MIPIHPKDDPIQHAPPSAVFQNTTEATSTTADQRQPLVLTSNAMTPLFAFAPETRLNRDLPGPHHDRQPSRTITRLPGRSLGRNHRSIDRERLNPTGMSFQSTVTADQGHRDPRR